MYCYLTLQQSLAYSIKLNFEIIKGPYIITAKISEELYLLRDEVSMKLLREPIHVERIMMFHSDCSNYRQTLEERDLSGDVQIIDKTDASPVVANDAVGGTAGGDK